MVSFSKNKILNHPVKKIYNIIADVKKYPDFLPWCNKITIKEKTKKYIITEVKVGFKNINETYICKVLLYPQKRIPLEYISGPFEYLEIDWKFQKFQKKGLMLVFFVILNLDHYF